MGRFFLFGIAFFLPLVKCYATDWKRLASVALAWWGGGGETSEQRGNGSLEKEDEMEENGELKEALAVPYVRKRECLQSNWWQGRGRGYRDGRLVFGWCWCVECFFLFSSVWGSGGGLRLRLGVNVGEDPDTGRWLWGKIFLRCKKKEKWDMWKSEDEWRGMARRSGMGESGSWYVRVRGVL